MPTTLLIDCNETALSRSDRAAVEHAMGRFGLPSGSAVHVCCPSGNETAIRYAMAAGAGKLVAVDQIEAGLVVCGLEGLGFDGELTAARIAIQHRAQLVLNVLNFSKQGDRLEILRKLERGDMESLLIDLPAVLVMAESASPIQYLSRYRQASAFMPKEKPRQPSAPRIQWEAVRPRTKTAELSNKTGGGAHQRMFATFGIDNVSAGMGSSDDSEILTDPEECAVQLVRYLAHHGFIDSKQEPADTIQMPGQTASPDQPIPLKLTQSDQCQTSANQTIEKFPSSLNRPVPRPVQLTPEVFRVKRIRQPRKMNQPRLAEPQMDRITQARYQRRPRPIPQSEPANQRGPIPLTNQVNT